MKTTLEARYYTVESNTWVKRDTDMTIESSHFYNSLSMCPIPFSNIDMNAEYQPNCRVAWSEYSQKNDMLQYSVEPMNW